MRSTATPPTRGGSSPKKADRSGTPRPARDAERSGNGARTGAPARQGARTGAPARSGARTSAPARQGARTSAPARPVGKAPRPGRATYRRRRLLALILLLALAVGVAFGVRAAADAIAAADETLPRLVSSTPIAPEDLEDAPTGPPTEEELANPVDCRPSAIGLTVDLASATVAAGATTAMPVTVTNTGQVPCLVDVGARLVLTIYSGEDMVWTSQHCASGSARRILLDVAGEDATSFRWTGTRSAPGCPAEQPVAAAGTYRAVVTLMNADEAPEPLATVERAFTIV